MTSRSFSIIDSIINEVDKGLRTSFGPAPRADRANPAVDKPDNEIPDRERELAGRFMRINHAGEICAQGLYQGQALTARLPRVRKKMEEAAQEENDHIAWTADRIRELGNHTSYLNPAWYGLSFAMGAIAGAVGDKISLGFVAATEERVCQHLKDHLKELPSDPFMVPLLVISLLLQADSNQVANILIPCF